MTKSLISRLEAAAGQGNAVTLVGADEPERVPWSRLHDDARRLAAAMQSHGVAPGDRVALLGSTSRSLLTAIQATWLAGAAVIVLPLRTRTTSEEEFRKQTLARVTTAEVALIVSDPDLIPAVANAPDHPPVVIFPELEHHAAEQGEGTYQRPSDDPDADAIIQFTSGSTADPKGVCIPHRCVMDNNDALAERAPIGGPDDVVVSWCPLYHDMGLVMVMTYAMSYGADLVIAPPTRFITAPGRWMEWMSEFGGTWTIGPNFSLAIAARLLAQANLDLSRCQRVGNGSEPVDPKAMDSFAVAARRHGFDPSAMYAAYGMAEATVVISIPDAGTGFMVDVVDGDVLEHDLRAEAIQPDHPRARRLARCGRPLRGMELRVVDPESGAILDSRVLGEIEVRGPSVVPGYFKRPDATAAMFRSDGWLRTGDLGYLAEQDVVICGRLKDLIIVGGRNIFPEDIERAADAVDGVRKGNVIAFGVDSRNGRESVIIVAEVKDPERGAVVDGISRAVRETVGVRPEDIALIRAGTLPKTSSGKLRRSICRARYLTSELELL